MSSAVGIPFLQGGADVNSFLASGHATFTGYCRSVLGGLLVSVAVPLGFVAGKHCRCFLIRSQSFMSPALLRTLLSEFCSAPHWLRPFF